MKVVKLSTLAKKFVENGIEFTFVSDHQGDALIVPKLDNARVDIVLRGKGNRFRVVRSAGEGILHNDFDDIDPVIEFVTSGGVVTSPANPTT